jgi:hypothetical protein
MSAGLWRWWGMPCGESRANENLFTTETQSHRETKIDKKISL